MSCGRSLAASREGSSTGGPRFRSQSDVTPDGGFLAFLPPVDLTGTNTRRLSRINVVVNWFEELRRRVPVPGP